MNPRLVKRSKRHGTGNFSTQLFLFLGLWFAFSSLAAQQNVPMTKDPIEQVGDQYEALMLNRVYQQMLDSQGLLQAGDDNPFAPSHAEMIYRGMLNDELTKKLAGRRFLGVGNLVVRQLRGQKHVGSLTRNLVKSENRNDLSRLPKPTPGGS